MTASGIIFANTHDSRISELTRKRTIASVPFGCRYRLIDFTLSNMVNSNIYNISVITQNNYQSLMDHIGSGKDWDLARRSGGIKILPPNISSGGTGANANGTAATRMSSLKSVFVSISKITDDFVVMSDCDVICNMDFSDMIEYHCETGADITIATRRTAFTDADTSSGVILETDENACVNRVVVNPGNYSGETDVSLNMMVMRTELLKKIVADAIAYGYNSFTHDIISGQCGHFKINVYRYDGYFADIDSTAKYFKSNMDLIFSGDARKSLFDVKNRPVYTKVRNSIPTYYASTSRTKGSLIADGCVIEGEVENSVLFRGVKVGKGTVVKNSILMQDTQCGDNVYLNCVIADKNVVIRDGRVLSGCECQPYVIDKGKMI